MHDKQSAEWNPAHVWLSQNIYIIYLARVDKNDWSKIPSYIHIKSVPQYKNVMDSST